MERDLAGWVGGDGVCGLFVMGRMFFENLVIEYV